MYLLIALKIVLLFYANLVILILLHSQNYIHLVISIVMTILRGFGIYKLINVNNNITYYMDNMLSLVWIIRISLMSIINHINIRYKHIDIILFNNH